MCTVQELFKAYLGELATRALPGHVSRVAVVLARVAVDLGPIQADSVRPAELLAWRAARIERDGVSRETHNKEVGYVRAAYEFGRSTGVIATCPDRVLRRLAVREADRRRPAGLFTPEELRRFLAAARAVDELRRAGPHGIVPQHPLWRFLVETGSRRKETLALDWSDIRLDARAAVHRPANTKTGRRRIVSFSPELACELEELGMHEGPVFRTPVGLAWAPNANNLAREFRRVMEAAALPRADREGRHRSPHSFRHTLATLLAAEGTAPRVAQRALGHADVRTTLGVYTAADDEGVRCALDRVHGRIGA